MRNRTVGGGRGARHHDWRRDPPFPRQGTAARHQGSVAKLRAVRRHAATGPGRLRTLRCDFEIYSIDETFLDLSGFGQRDLVVHANAMRAQVQLWTTIPTCVGIAETKTLAKLANAAAKKSPEFAGVADLRDDGVRRDVLHAFAVGDVWGVGGATARKLTDLGIIPPAR
ncbi:MAG TPA: hypothetical protein VNJ10_08085 [Sphingomonas sp.]|nr:hypothetical protein [Sphingomonas sp.]